MKSEIKKPKEWYLPNIDENEEPLGPFSSEEIKARFLSGELKLDSYLWNNSLEEERWHHLFETEEVSEFLSDYPKGKFPKKRSKGRAYQVIKVNFDYSQDGEYGIENEYRRYPRAPMDALAIVHNQKHYSEARCIDISEKGIFVEINDKDVFSKGEEVIITVLKSKDFETFSVPSVVMKVVQSKEYKGHGLYFLRLNPQIKRKIAEHVCNKLKKEKNKNSSECA